MEFALGFFWREYCFPCARIRRRAEEVILDYLAWLGERVRRQVEVLGSCAWVLHYIGRWVVLSIGGFALRTQQGGWMFE